MVIWGDGEGACPARVGCRHGEKIHEGNRPSYEETRALSRDHDAHCPYLVVATFACETKELCEQSIKGW